MGLAVSIIALQEKRHLLILQPKGGTLHTKTPLHVIRRLRHKSQDLRVNLVISLVCEKLERLSKQRRYHTVDWTEHSTWTIPDIERTCGLTLILARAALAAQTSAIQPTIRTKFVLVHHWAEWTGGTPVKHAAREGANRAMANVPLRRLRNDVW